MTLGFYVRALVRESRGSRGRLTFFIACLAVGVAAVVAVAGLSASLRDGIRREARQLLAADLAVRGNQPIPPEALTAIAALPGARRTDVKETVTVAAAPGVDGQPGPSQLVELKVVDGFYPFYGKLDLRPARPLHELLTPGTAVVAAELLSRWKLKVGDSLQIGGQPFRIAASVLSEPDRVSISFTIGPRVFLSGAGFARTHLEDQGSRVELPDAGPAAGRDLDRRARRRRRAAEAGSPRRRELPRGDLPAGAAVAARRTSRGSSSSSGWSPCCRSSSAASASPRACAPGSPAGWTPSRSSSAWGCARARSSRSTSGRRSCSASPAASWGSSPAWPSR